MSAVSGITSVKPDVCMCHSVTGLQLGFLTSRQTSLLIWAHFSEAPLRSSILPWGWPQEHWPAIRDS